MSELLDFKVAIYMKERIVMIYVRWQDYFFHKGKCLCNFLFSFFFYVALYFFESYLQALYIVKMKNIYIYSNLHTSLYHFLDKHLII